MMRRKNALISVLMAAVMTLSAAACGSAAASGEKPQEKQEETTAAAEVTEAAAEETTETAAEAVTEAPAAEETAEAEPADAPVKAFTNDGMTLSVPEALLDLLVIDTPDPAEDGVLFYVSEKESVELAKAQDAEFVGAGWLFSIGRVDEARANEAMDADIPGMDVFASDADGNYYVYYHPTDVRVVREEYNDETLKSWEYLNTWAGTMKGTFFMDNAGLDTKGLTDTTYLADNLAYGYFRKIGEMEQGTAGASLKAAQTAFEVMRYAASNSFQIQDQDVVRSEMLKSWEILSEEEQAAFDENFMTVVTLLDSCKADWESQRGLFEDAGCAQMMELLLGSPSAREAWATLLGNTLTLGNTDGN